MGRYIDLHIHSKYSSDGLLSPEEIIIQAKENDFRTIAIADHDTINGVEEAIRSGLKYDIEVIPAVEITTEYNKHFYHILAYYFDGRDKEFNLLIDDLIQIRKKKNLFRIQEIKREGYKVPDAIIEIIEKGELIVGPTIAKAVVEDDENQQKEFIIDLKKQNILEPYIIFYKQIIKNIDKKYSQQTWISTLEAINKISKAKSISVLAHPGAPLFSAGEEEIKMFKDKGLLGIEVYSTYHTEEQIEDYKKLAMQLGLLITGGSDFHGKVKKHIPFGIMKIEDYTIIEKLRETKNKL